MDAPVTSRISRIFDPPFPIREPHCDAGTIIRKVIGGRVDVLGATKLVKSCDFIKQELESYTVSFQHHQYGDQRRASLSFDLRPRLLRPKMKAVVNISQVMTIQNHSRPN